MSERPTPETDAFAIKFKTPCGEKYWVPVDLSRRLERERDEVREKAERYRLEANSLMLQRDEAREELAGIENKMRVELGGHPDSELWGEAGLIAATMRCVDAVGELTEQRDEARTTIKDAKRALNATAYEGILLAAMRVKEERDEARSVASDLSDIASKHLSFLLAITPTKPNEKHEKETEKVIDALKRWKKL